MNFAREKMYEIKKKTHTHTTERKQEKKWEVMEQERKFRRFRSISFVLKTFCAKFVSLKRFIAGWLWLSQLLSRINDYPWWHTFLLMLKKIHKIITEQLDNVIFFFSSSMISAFVKISLFEPNAHWILYLLITVFNV